MGLAGTVAAKVWLGIRLQRGRQASKVFCTTTQRAEQYPDEAQNRRAGVRRRPGSVPGDGYAACCPACLDRYGDDSVAAA